MYKLALVVLFASWGFVTSYGQSVTVDCKTLKPNTTTSGNIVTVVCSTPTPTPTPIPPISSTGSPYQPTILEFPYPAQSGRTLVATSSNFQSVINSAAYGDTILLSAGTTYTGNFTLPKKTGNGWIIIRTSAQDSSFVLLGTRVAPLNSAAMPKIISPNSDAAIKTDLGAYGYRLVGLEVTTTATLNYGLVKLGDGGSLQNAQDKVATDLVVDRCYIHGNPTGDVSRGIGLNSGRTAVIDSFISEIHAVGSDAQAICGWNGSGPFKIVNNYLEASGENFMLGGADPYISSLVPSDIEFRANYVYKPLSWKVGNPAYAGKHWLVKNSFELKNAQRLLVSDNIFENNWADGQSGFMVVMKSVNQENTAPWSVVQDVAFVNNTIRNSGSGFNLLGTDSGQPGIKMSRVLIKNNQLESVKAANGGEGVLFQISEVNDLTVIQNKSWFSAIDVRNQEGNALIRTYGGQSLRFLFTDNTVLPGLYGVKGDGVASGNATLNFYFPSCLFKSNFIIGADLSTYPTGNFNTL